MTTPARRRVAAALTTLVLLATGACANPQTTPDTDNATEEGS